MFKSQFSLPYLSQGLNSGYQVWVGGDGTFTHWNRETSSCLVISKHFLNYCSFNLIFHLWKKKNNKTWWHWVPKAPTPKAVSGCFRWDARSSGCAQALLSSSFHLYITQLPFSLWSEGTSRFDRCALGRQKINKGLSYGLADSTVPHAILSTC